MPAYRIKWSLYRVTGETKQEAAKKLCEVIKHHPEFYFDLEDASIVDERKSLLKRFLLG